jgi:RNA polymerase sigma factor (sigma-70 family)
MRDDLDALVAAARGGDDVAWAALVRRFDRLVRGIARSYRLSPTDVDDAVQATWLRLFGAIDRLREPAALPGWLTTTAHRESLRLLQAPVREHITDDPRLGDGIDTRDPATEVLAAEQRETLARAVRSLPRRQRKLFAMLAADPHDYRQISAELAIPMGSIGPTRGRMLARLGRHPELRALRVIPSGA